MADQLLEIALEALLSAVSDLQKAKGEEPADDLVEHVADQYLLQAASTAAHPEESHNGF